MITFTVKIIYENIRRIRISKGYSQEYVASKLGMNQSNYGKLEKGNTQLTIERLEQIAKVLEVNMFTIMISEKNPEFIKWPEKEYDVIWQSFRSIVDEEAKKKSKVYLQLYRETKETNASLGEQVNNLKEIIRLLKANKPWKSL